MKKFITLILMLMLSATSYSEVTPESVIKSFEKKYVTINDYQLRLHEWCTKGKKLEKRIINYYFKKPRNIRMDILKGNRAFDKGSVGVYNGGKKVAGHRGGILAAVALNVSKHSSLSTTVRGTTFDESDMQATLERLLFHLANSSITLNTIDGKIHELTCIPSSPSINEGISRDIIAVEVSTMLPLYSDRYEGPEQVQHAEWSDYIINADLPIKLFKVRYKAARLKGLGIESIHELPVEKDYKFE